jgi:hypothetical protein
VGRGAGGHTHSNAAGGGEMSSTGRGDAPGRVMLRSSKTMWTCWRPDSRKPAVKSALKKPWERSARVGGTDGHGRIG